MALRSKNRDNKEPALGASVAGGDTFVTLAVWCIWWKELWCNLKKSYQQDLSIEVESENRTACGMNGSFRWRVK